MKEMVTLTRGSCRETTRSTEVQEWAGPNLGTDGITTGSPGRARVVVHARSGSWVTNRMASIEDAVPEAEGTEVRSGRSGVSVHSRGDLDSMVHKTDSRQTCSRVGNGSHQFKTSRTILVRCFTLPVHASQKKPASYDGISSFQDYFVQFEMIGDLNRWDEKPKGMKLATSLRGAAQTVLGDFVISKEESFINLCLL